MLFIVGGVMPIVLALVLWKVLPESPRYLAKRRERWPELTGNLRRMGHDIPDDVEYVEAAAVTVAGPRPRSRVRLARLFESARSCATRRRCSGRSSSA